MITVDKSNFEQEVLQSKVPVMVKFTATWCGPCQAIQPLLEEIAKDVEGKAKVVKLDIDDSPELAAKYRVKSIPTMVVLKNGEVAASQVGRAPKDKIVALLSLENK